MPAQTIQWWDVIGGVLQRRGYTQVPGFEDFAVGTVRPAGRYDPDPTNVGVRPGVALSNYAGTLNLTAGQTVSGLAVTGPTTGRGGIVKDSMMLGPLHATAQSAIAVGTSYNFGGTVFDHCIFDGTGRESEWTDCIDGGNFTARYCEITRGVDGIQGNAVGNATIECCRIYNGFYDSFWNDSTGAPRPGHIGQSSGDTHSDGIQLLQGAGWVIRGNYIGGSRVNVSTASQLDPTVPADKVIIDARNLDNLDFNNSAIIVNTVGAKMGALIEYNWLAGGAARLNIATSASDKLDGLTARYNRFMRNADYGYANNGFYIYASADHLATLTGNVFDSDGTPVTIVTH